jgi:general secretion pathway protein H
MPTQWLSPDTRAAIIGAAAVQLGPEPLIAPQRIGLQIGEHHLVISTDGLAPFAPMDDEPVVAARP